MSSRDGVVMASLTLEGFSGVARGCGAHAEFEDSALPGKRHARPSLGALCVPLRCHSGMLTAAAVASSLDDFERGRNVTAVSPCLCPSGNSGASRRHK